MTTPQTGQLRIVPKYHWLTFMFAAFSPKAIINGHEISLKWGENLIPAPLGQHQIEIYVPYLWKVGRATIVVDNTTGVPTVHYSAPVWTFSKGAIGFEPQQHPALVATYIAYGVFFALLLLCCCGSIVFNGE